MRFLVPLLLVLLWACNPQTPNTDTAHQETLMQAVAAFNQAFKAGNVQQLESMITANYQHSNGNSKAIGKTTWLSFLSKRKKSLENGSLVINSYEMSETQVAFFENTAILTAKISVASTQSGNYTENAYRVTHVWVYENQQWKRASFHDGKIK